MSEVVFKDLISAIKTSVVEASDMVARKQVENFQSLYFQKDGTPNTVKMRLPSSKFEGDQPKEIEVPLICIAPTSSFKLKEISLDFSVEFTELFGPSKDNGKNDSLHARLVAGKLEHPNTANISIKIEGSDPPEGVLRINDYFTKFLP
ncbi:DUF2589 domain-containing protein [Bacillus litorisediminis]|uniref:DUF2589 domain-containing protein n=1 Tax=Bacillus litorisediminis TaxID=2922713 RepID=UPI001FAC276E|nr:DUF2589 domain-containing protein [Bacillus litorisediminis]